MIVSLVDILDVLDKDTVERIVLVLTAVTALAGVFAAIGALRQVRRVRDVNAAQLFLGFSERYNAEEMAEAMRALVSWYQEQGANFAKIWNECYEKREEKAVELNRARRRVSRYFDDVARLYEVGLINRRLARALLATYGIQVFYEICEPMNDVRMPNRLQIYPNIVRALRPSYGTRKIL